ncbi:MULTISPECIES: glycosyltransferase family 4 protein [unclassified Acinetobacter]|uniref:glycosyltransferase family 4 protein n=1 Tax=unclassified Acinetobacter TaxID=196816 RepID=UPI0015D0D38B|nr:MULTISPECIES: glycosyltransferase family 4 protein [unclassified Acinetobacter]UUS60884.1 glycosyltransferase family 4 protein [Acinetobacter sp. YH16056_T]
MNKVILLIGTTASNLYLFRKDFILSCINKGYQVYALVSEYDDYWIKKIQKLGAEVITYQLSRSGLNPFKDLKSMVELKRYINQYNPDIVFSFFTKPVIYGSLAAKLAGSPKVIGMIEGLGSPFTEHPTGQSWKMKMIRFFQVTLYRIVFPFLDKIIFLNEDDPKDLINKNKIFHKKNAVNVLGAIGLDLKDYPFQKWDESKDITFIFVARLLAEKGIYEYIQAAKLVKAQFPDVKFKVIGGLDLENPYGLSKKELDRLVAEDIIIYPGFVTNVTEHVADSAVFVLPSYYREGVPRSTQEAMAIGRPVITTDVPGCRETVVDGVNGFLVPKWNVDALVEKMCYFIENPIQINQMGHASYTIACEKFDAQKVNEKLMKIIGLNK